MRQHIVEFPVHIGDFLSGTMHMSAEQVGSYILLIMAHMQAGEDGLPNDDVQLARIAKVSPRVWERVKPILSEKFEISETFWSHKKCIKVLRKISEKSNAARAKSLKRHRAGSATAKLQHCCSSANQKPKTKKEKNIKKEKGEKEDLFVQFWQAYPRPSGIGEVKRIWEELMVQGEDPAALVAAAQAFAKRQAGTETQFIPKPARFLREKIYLDPDLQPAKKLPLGPLEPWQEEVCQRIEPVHYLRWFAGAKLNGLCLYVPTRLAADHIRHHYLQALKGIIERVDIAKDPAVEDRPDHQEERAQTDKAAGPS